jgi:hypothetical protein
MSLSFYAELPPDSCMSFDVSVTNTFQYNLAKLDKKLSLKKKLFYIISSK